MYRKWIFFHHSNSILFLCDIFRRSFSFVHIEKQFGKLNLCILVVKCSSSRNNNMSIMAKLRETRIWKKYKTILSIYPIYICLCVLGVWPISVSHKWCVREYKKNREKESTDQCLWTWKCCICWQHLFLIRWFNKLVWITSRIRWPFATFTPEWKYGTRTTHKTSLTISG